MNPHSSAAIINYSYRTQEVRDLAWACFSPAMIEVEQVAAPDSGIKSSYLQLTPARNVWLEHLDRDNAALLSHLAVRPSHRLGVYFERLWHFFLAHDPDVELVAHNLAVRDEGRTLGEFDCIYYCRERERHVHLELAVKYFLGVPRGVQHTLPSTQASDTGANAQEWLGPDRRDRLRAKLDQLLLHQVQLSNTASAKLQLQALGIDRLDKEIALKGYLFQPQTAPLPPPPGYNHACAFSHWIGCDQLEPHCDSLAETAFAILPKMYWLSGAQCRERCEILSRRALRDRVIQHLQHDRYPLLVAALNADGTEVSRFFVTPPGWPADFTR